MSIRFAAFLFSLFIAACSTVEIVDSPPMQPPPGLTVDQVETAIRAAITRSNRSSSWAGGNWAVEESRPGTIIAGLRVRTHYLQVAIMYSNTRIMTKIIKSQNLKQDGNSIHKKALAWQRRLESYIYQEVSKLVPDVTMQNH